jgi:hypothetical protein
VISTAPAEVLNVCTGTGAASIADAAEIPAKSTIALIHEPNSDCIRLIVPLLISRLLLF